MQEGFLFILQRVSQSPTKAILLAFPRAAAVLFYLCSSPSTFHKYTRALGLPPFCILLPCLLRFWIICHLGSKVTYRNLFSSSTFTAKRLSSGLSSCLLTDFSCSPEGVNKHDSATVTFKTNSRSQSA